MVTPREIVAEAWAITTKEKKLWRWGFFSALLETMRSTELLLYQAYYMYWFWKGETVGLWDAEVLLFNNLPMWLFIVTVVFSLILIFFEIFAPTFATGAVIGLSAKAHKKEPVKGGFILGLYNFFPIMELHGMFLLSSTAVLFTLASFVIRYSQDTSMRVLTLILLFVLAIISVLFHFFASFSEEAVVIHKQSVFGAIGRSLKLIMSNVQHVFFLILLLFVISIRIFVNAIVLVIIPAVLVGTCLLLMSFITPFASLVITTFIGIAVMFAVGYFFAYLHVFRQTVWTITYLELSKNKDLDVIDAE